MPEIAAQDPRTLARTVVLQAEFASDLSGKFEESGLAWLIEENLVSPKHAGDVLALSQTLLRGLEDKRVELDELIQTFAPAWPVHLLSPVDRNILRIALFELLYHTNTPAKTAINEAVELAKVFGSDSTARFVNGVLGSVMTALSKGELGPDKFVSERR